MENKQKDFSSLLRRYVDDLYAIKDLDQLKDKLKEDSEDEVFDEFSKEIWEEASLRRLHTNKEREQYKKEARILLKKLENKKKVKYRKVWLAIASTAAILCFVFGGIKYIHLVNDQNVTYHKVCTSYGEQKEVHLPDGTILVLNSCSWVRYPNHFIGKERRIKLDGEGYFKVKHDENNPFIVQTHSFSVKVLGTCFNIKAYSSDEMMSVNVESGKVQINLSEAMMRLKANEQVFIDKVSGNYSKHTLNHEVALWRKGSLCFDSTSIYDVARELERIYNCHIVFAKGQTFDNLISGEHDNKSLESVLQSIEYTSGIHYKISDDQVYIYKK